MSLPASRKFKQAVQNSFVQLLRQFAEYPGRAEVWLWPKCLEAGTGSFGVFHDKVL